MRRAARFPPGASGEWLCCLGSFLPIVLFVECCLKCNVVTKCDDTTLPVYSTTADRHYAGDPATAEAQYDSEAYFSGAVLKKSTDGDPRTWEDLEVTTSVPPEANFLLIGFYAHEDVVDDPPTAPEFAGHYVDGLELELTRLKP